MKKSRKHNLKYYCSEAAAIGIALTTSTLTAYLTDKVTDSNMIISGASAIGGTIGWILGNLGIYSILHMREYKDGERNFKYDVKANFKSNLEGIATTYAVRIPLQYVLQEYFKISPPIAASISHIAGGIGGTVIRVFRNYQRNIFGNKDKKEKEIHDSVGLQEGLGNFMKRDSNRIYSQEHKTF